MSGSINQDSKEGLEIYKGKIIGFTNTGMAAYSGEGARLCAVDTCELCGQVVDSHLSHADFCPICAVLLGLTTENFVREYCLERYQSQLDDLYNDFEYKRYMISLVDGFKLGIQFALKNASATLEHKIKFNYYND